MPEDFRFAVKLPKTITHEQRLVGCVDLLCKFRDEASALGEKLAVLLVQLPPSFAFDAAVAGDFFRVLAGMSPAAIACEPRHPTWFEAEADELLRDLKIARVAADPALNLAAGSPGGWRDLSYYRLHGSPVMYRSAYGDDQLSALATALGVDAAAGRSIWCMFDNTASGAATHDALRLPELLTNRIG